MKGNKNWKEGDPFWADLQSNVPAVEELKFRHSSTVKAEKVQSIRVYQQMKQESSSLTFLIHIQRKRKESAFE